MSVEWYCSKQSEKFCLLRARKEEREGGRVRKGIEEGEGGIRVGGEEEQAREEAGRIVEGGEGEI